MRWSAPPAPTRYLPRFARTFLFLFLYRSAPIFPHHSGGLYITLVSGVNESGPKMPLPPLRHRPCEGSLRNSTPGIRKSIRKVRVFT
jgi:hypothetical protein